MYLKKVCWVALIHTHGQINGIKFVESNKFDNVYNKI